MMETKKNVKKEKINDKNPEINIYRKKKKKK